MSSDSTELTFIRCPACRSLVPAMSSVCRMCGSGLSAAEDDEEQHSANGKESESARVRQRTVHSQTSDMHDAVKRIREEFQSAPAEEEVNDMQQGEEETLQQDSSQDMARHSEPLNVDDMPFSPGETYPVAPEMNKQPIAKEQQAAPTTTMSTQAEELDSELDVVDPLSAFLEEVDEEEVLSKHQDEPLSAQKDEGRVEEPEPAAINRGQDAQKQSGKSEDVAAKTEAEKQPSKRADSHELPRAVVQSGMSRKGGKLSFRSKQGSDSSGSSTHEKPVKQESQQVAKERSMSTSANNESTERYTSHSEKKSTRPTQGAMSSSRVQKESDVDGRLVGWLVSYLQASGEAFEMREGRFFVTRQSLKKSDFIIDDNTISTPHALVKIDPGLGVIVQDLMSERGVFVRRRGEDAYSKLTEESIVVEHGDWVRFGDVEYLVSLIAHVGVE